LMSSLPSVASPSCAVAASPSCASEQATLRDCCNIESTELSQLLVYDIGPCKYKKARIVVCGCYGASGQPIPPCQDCSGGRIRVVLEQKSPMDRWIRQPRGLQSSCWRAAALMARTPFGLIAAQLKRVRT